MNCSPCPFPTCGTPAGSKGGTTRTVEASEIRVARRIVVVFMVISVGIKGGGSRASGGLDLECGWCVYVDSGRQRTNRGAPGS